MTMFRIMSSVINPSRADFDADCDDLQILRTLKYRYRSVSNADFADGHGVSLSLDCRWPERSPPAWGGAALGEARARKEWITPVRNFVLMVAGLASLASIASAATAPGAPGKEAFWAYAGKTGIGTAYEPYVTGEDGELRAAGRSKVWFSVADGMLTETMFGLIHEAQIKTARVAVQTSSGLVVDGENTTARTAYLQTDRAGRPLAPAYRLITRDKKGAVEIEKRIFTDPDRNALVMRVTVRPLKGAVTPYLLVEPHMGNAASGNRGEATRNALSAHAGGDVLTVRPSRPFSVASVGFLGVSDGLTRLRAGHGLAPTYSSTGEAGGAILLTGQLGRASARARTFNIVFGFGTTEAESDATARATLKSGYSSVLEHFEGVGGKVGWNTYLAGLQDLPRLAAQAGDGGRLAYASAIALKVHEDKTHAGALIASLSNPWGDTVPATAPSTGYKAVWPRDFYQCAMALAALGDRQTPVAAFRYLRAVQVKASTPGAEGAFGWFQQKSHVDGQAEWKAVQLDQTAMPIMLGWSLWKRGLIGEAELKA
eukprot:gene18266-18528_t